MEVGGLREWTRLGFLAPLTFTIPPLELHSRLTQLARSVPGDEGRQSWYDPDTKRERPATTRKVETPDEVLSVFP